VEEWQRDDVDQSKKFQLDQVLVAQACSLSYSGGKNQEDHGLKPAWANTIRDPILKKTSQK
jgi:hypothetical protein